MKQVAIFIIKIYRKYFSVLLGSSCRYTPTCSRYWIEALETYGFIKGMYLGIGRLLRCHPFAGWGYDPIPKQDIKKDIRCK